MNFIRPWSELVAREFDRRPYTNYLDIMISNGYGNKMALAAKMGQYTDIDMAERVKKFTHGPEHPIGNAQYVDRFGYGTDEYKINTKRPDQAGYKKTEDEAKRGGVNRFLRELNAGASNLESIYTTVPVQDELSGYMKKSSRKPLSSATVSPKSLHVVAEKASKKVKDGVGLTTNTYVTPLRAYTYGKGAEGPVAESSADFRVFGSTFIKSSVPLTITAAGAATVYDEAQAQDVTLESLLPPDAPEDELLLQDMQRDAAAPIPADDPVVEYPEEDPYMQEEETSDPYMQEEEEAPIQSVGIEKDMEDLFPEEEDMPFLTGDTNNVYENDAAATATPSWT